jgi:hypothetical protein
MKLTLLALAEMLPLYTWPRDAAAIGSSEISANNFLADEPSSCSINFNASDVGKGGIRSCSFASSWQYALGKISGRVLRACASLI